MIDDDLKCCPFCKSRGATVVGSKNGSNYYRILCVNQHCHVRTRNYHTRMEAKDSWNRRVNGMNVYAVIERCADDYGSDYNVVVDEHVYLKEEDARKRLEELVKKNRWSEFEIREFEVRE